MLCTKENVRNLKQPIRLFIIAILPIRLLPCLCRFAIVLRVVAGTAQIGRPLRSVRDSVRYAASSSLKRQPMGSFFARHE